MEIAIAVVAAVALGMITPGVAHAAPPANDDFDASTAITALPFTTQVDRTEATRALDDPANCVQRPAEGSVWFHHTATENGIVRVSTDGSDLDVKLSVLPEPNDAMASAATTTVPGDHQPDLTLATAEPGEAPPSCDTAATRSVWYRYTPRPAPSSSRSTAT
ncbi:hypothetical protein [Lentzea atacamensis]|uniref:hypothetical protein n=1 Tax=Lentzea atacamensis TaxID=531938 RepID=UPI001472A83E|nr:hypothetical protein [Lentzea atacamensis]